MYPDIAGYRTAVVAEFQEKGFEAFSVKEVYYLTYLVSITFHLLGKLMQRRLFLSARNL